MIVLMVVIFLVGYTLIALEHPLKINKAAVALFIGGLLWIIYMLLAPQIVPQVSGEQFNHFLETQRDLSEQPFLDQIRSFVVDYQILEDVGSISETILFLMAAMAIVELIDSHGCFLYITERITTRNKKKLLWIISMITFFMSAVLDNLTTTIVMVMLLRRILTERKERWLFGSIVVLAANSGGAWSPIGDVTTIMLWVKGNVTVHITPNLILPSIVSILVPVLIAQTFIKGSISNEENNQRNEDTVLINNFQNRERLAILIFGVGILVLAPVFKLLTHLPPFIWLLLGMSMLWIFTEVMYNRKKRIPENAKMRLTKVLGRLDFATLMFFLGILLAVDALKNAGILSALSTYMAYQMPNVYAQGLVIGLLSAIVDNVPLVAASIGMYPVVDSATLSTLADPVFMQNFVLDGSFWHFLAYCAGVGGSILIIGSAAGVILMGLEGVSFGWYLKKISLIAFVGYLAGAGVYILQNMILH